MKSLFTLLFFTLTIAVSAQQEKLVGSWTGEDKGDVGTVIFDEEGYFTLINNGKTMGGKEFDLTSEVKAKMTYAVKPGSNPIEVTLTMTAIDIDYSDNMYGLIRFVNDNEIIFALGELGVKIDKITDTNSMTFRRTK